MVDDSREEHRMIIFGNDSDPVQEHLIREDGASRGFSTQNGILERKIHAESYTVTLYALLKDYGLIPVFGLSQEYDSADLTTITKLRAHRSVTT